MESVGDGSHNIVQYTDDSPNRMESSQQYVQEQRSHIAIIQMAPPAASASSSKISTADGSLQTPSVPVPPGSVVKSTRGHPAAARRGAAQSENSKKRRHQCTVQGCTYNTPHSKDLTRHMRKHTGEKPYSCDRCTKSFTRYDKLVMHIRIHEGYRPFSCNICSYAATDSSSLRKHLRTHSDERPYKCHLCSYSSKDSSQLVVHIRYHTGDSPYLCYYNGCGAAFKTPSDLSRHTRLHRGEKPYKCSYCDYSAAVKCNLNVHMRRHTHPSRKRGNSTAKSLSQRKTTMGVEEPFNVEDAEEEVCEVPQMTETVLPFQYACKLCDYKADTIDLFVRHMEDLHPDSNSMVRHLDGSQKNKGRPPSAKNTIEDSEGRSFKCTRCDASFVCEESLRCHIRQHGTIPNRPANVDPELYTPPSRIRSPVAHSYREANNTYHEMQRMPVLHSVITENPSVIASVGSAVQHESTPMYLINYNPGSTQAEHADHSQINIIYQVDEAVSGELEV